MRVADVPSRLPPASEAPAQALWRNLRRGGEWWLVHFVGRHDHCAAGAASLDSRRRCRDGAATAVGRGYAAWGIGFFLFVLIAALLYARHVYHALPEPRLAPPLWVGLGPIGAGSLALARLAPFTAILRNRTAVGAIVAGSALAAAVLWGFGIWWPATAILLGRYRRTGPLPYGVGWRALTFPLGAYTVASLVLAAAWNVAVLSVLGALLFVLLVIFWLVVTVNTLWHIRTGHVWRRQ